MAAVTITMSADDSRLQAAHNRMLNDMQKILDKNAKLGDQSKKLTEEERRALAVKEALAKQEKENLRVQERAAKVIKDMAGPQEEFNAKVREAIELKNKGVLTTAQLQQRYKQLKAELRDASGETQRLKAAEAEEERAKAKATATTQRYMTTVEKLQVELKEVKELHKQGRVELETVERAQRRLNDAQEKMHETGFQKAMKGLEGYATKVASVAGTIGLIATAWQDARQAQEEAVQSLKSKGDSERNLVQIAKDTKDLQSMTSQAEELSVAHGVPVETVNKAIFSGRSENFSESVPEIVASNQVVDTEAALTVAGKTPVLFDGAIKPLEAVSMALKAGEPSNMDFEDIAKNLPKVAEGGSIAKASVEESMATLAVMSSRFASGETDADRIKAFATKVGTDREFGLAGQGIVKPVEKLDAMTPEKRAEFLGDSQELNVAYTLLSKDLPKIKEQTREMEKERAEFAAGRGALREKRAIAEANPRMQARKKIAQSEQKLEIEKEKANAIEGADRISTENAVKAQTETQKLGKLERFVNNRIIAPVAADFGAPEHLAKSANLALAPQLNPLRAIGLGVDVFRAFGGNAEAYQRLNSAGGFSPEHRFPLLPEPSSPSVGVGRVEPETPAPTKASSRTQQPAMSSPAQAPAAQQTAPITVDVKGGEQMMEAAKQMQSAAAKMNRPQSMTSAARAQAARAN